MFRSILCTSDPSVPLLICGAFAFRGGFICSLAPAVRFDFFPVDVAVAVGFSVTVGSICGGLKARNMGFMGVPSNW